MNIQLSDITRAMRAQAWERAKAELQSVLCTFHGAHDSTDGQFDELDAKITAFISEVEKKGLHQ